MTEDIVYSLTEIIKDSLKAQGMDKGFVDELYLDQPLEARFGDLSCNIALKVSRVLKKPPFEVALDLIKDIEKRLQDSPSKPYIQQIKREGAGFINFYLSDGYFYEQISSVLNSGVPALKKNVGKGERVLIEFVSANPTGPLSVAHARQAVVGDCLASIFNFLGFDVKREYYLNDEGNQINILGESVKLRLKELKGEKVDFPPNYYQGEYIYDIAKESESQRGAKRSLPEAEPQELSDFAADYILAIIKKELDDFGVRFDHWYSQKELAKSGKIEEALDLLRSKDLVYEGDGALWFRSTQFGDDKDRVVRKSDGSYTYLAPDIAYHREKYNRGFSRLINLWGPDHHGYINRIKAAVAALGYPANSLSIVIVQLATIFREGKVVEMSTRKGQYITLREVLDEVGADAARFFFIMRRTSSHLDFDLELAKKQTSENPIFYVQYAYARISSILRLNPLKDNTHIDLALLKEKEEMDLIKKLECFSCILNICLKTEDPYMLTVYLQEVSEAFHKFYDSHRVLGQNEELTRARLALIKYAKIVIGCALDLLSISKPEKM